MMAITTPVICEIAYKTWLINEFGVDNLYFLEGDERGLLIDGGTGYFDAHKLLAELTDKPCDVVFTHAHPDHMGVMQQFERVYMHALDIPAARKILQRPRSLNGFTHTTVDTRIGGWEAFRVTEDMICPGNCQTEIIPIDEGHVFDLGGRRVTGWYMPGHTIGHMYFTDDVSRIAFTGDCVNRDNGNTLQAASTHVRRLNRFLDEQYGVLFDRIYTGHTNYGGDLNVRSLDINVVRRVREAFRAYMRGEITPIDFIPYHLPNRVFKVIHYGSGKNEVYPKVSDLLWEEGEEHIIP